MQSEIGHAYYSVMANMEWRLRRQSLLLLLHCSELQWSVAALKTCQTSLLYLYLLPSSVPSGRRSSRTKSHHRLSSARFCSIITYYKQTGSACSLTLQPPCQIFLRLYCIAVNWPHKSFLYQSYLRPTASCSRRCGCWRLASPQRHVRCKHKI